MSDAYQRLREFHQNVSGSLPIAAATTTQTLKAVRDSKHTIFVQRLTWAITTASAKTWTFRDSAGTPVPIMHAIPTDTVLHDSQDFGPDGVALTEGKDLQLLISAAGAAGVVTWEAYQRPTSTLSV